MKILVFQHISCEHPGIFRQFFSAAGIDWQAVELDAGDIIPDLQPFDALWVMGGPMEAMRAVLGHHRDQRSRGQLVCACHHLAVWHTECRHK